jgi:hypothetical protein
MIKDRRVYRCALCGDLLEIPDAGEPRVTVEGTGGQPNQRVLSIDGEEIHRCTAVSRNDLAAP